MQGAREQRKKERTKVFFVILVLSQMGKNLVCI